MQTYECINASGGARHAVDARALDQDGPSALDDVGPQAPAAWTHRSRVSRRRRRNPSPTFRMRMTLKAMDSVCDAPGEEVMRGGT